MYKVFFTQGNGMTCSCCRTECQELEEYITRREAVGRAADLCAHAYWGQDITGVGVKDGKGRWVGLDNKSFEAMMHRAVSRTGCEYVEDNCDTLETQEC